MNKPLERDIRNILKRCGETCHFKKAYSKKFLPDGYVVVSVKKFPETLVKELARLK